MGIVDTLSTFAELPTLLKLKKGMQPRPLDAKDCIAAMVERNAERVPNHTAFLFEGQTITWGEFNAMANRYARSFSDSGLTRGDVASVIMENRIEILATIIGLNKLGVTAALINTNLTGKPLSHCVNVTESKLCVFGEEQLAAIEGVKDELSLEEGRDYVFVRDQGTRPPPNWARDLGRESAHQTQENLGITGTLTLGETALYIFTSGTTGLPKAAVMSNRRFLASAALAHLAGFKMSEKDRLYCCLPLYHATGLMIGVGAAMSSGASVFIRRKFSASSFLPEVREYKTNCLIYIGELCRYLMNTQSKPDDHKNPLERIMGNGLRPDVWMGFKKRYGIKRITEFYGASEGNVAFANLMNKDRTVGMTSAEVALVRYDVDADEIVRDSNGFCIPVDEGQPGLLLGKITEQTVFEGYTNAEATEKKIVRNVLEVGDAWFNSGDLMKTVDVGFTLGYPHYQFVDRVGDTFRWKSENVSTNEVGEILNEFPQVAMCNVYGVEVPNADGRAGMVALTLNEGETALDIDAFSKFAAGAMPAYARPVFVRVQGAMDVTGTFKIVKGDLRKQGYDVTQFDDPVYVWKPGGNGYEPLTAAFLEQLENGELRY